MNDPAPAPPPSRPAVPRRSSFSSSAASSVSVSGESTPLPSSTTEVEGAADPSKPLPLSQWQIFCLCLPAAAVQVGWTVGESLLIPYLLSLGISPSIANLAWLINPLFGLFLQPMCGHASDNCSSSLGRRRPFLFAFHVGSVCGLLTVVFAAQLVPLFGFSAYDSEGHPSTAFILLIFLGFATADMCHDLLLMPARALLNDQLPDEQTDQGNSSFALISSLGSIIGLSMVIAPLDDVWPLKLLKIPIRATFVAASVLVMTSNLISFFIAGKIDTPLSEIRQRQAKDEEKPEGAAAENGNEKGGAVHSSPSPPPSKGGEGELLTLSSILFVYRVVPRPLVVIWLCQFFFWSHHHTDSAFRENSPFDALLSTADICPALFFALLQVRRVACQHLDLFICGHRHLWSVAHSHTRTHTRQAVCPSLSPYSRMVQ